MTTVDSLSCESQLLDLIASGTDPPLPQEWRHDSLFHECVNELTNLSLSRLHSEPLHLRDMLSRVVQDNQQLAVDNHATFIHTAQCSRQLLQEFVKVEQAAGDLHQQHIPTFVGACRTFMERAPSIVEAQNTIQVTLQKHNSILEILEVPQLMDTCVRSGYFDEALELVAYVRRMQRRHTHTLPVVSQIVLDTHAHTHVLLCQLIQQLRHNLQLPLCLKTVNYIRRMAVFSEPELRLLFLRCRDAWLRAALLAIDRDDPRTHATKTMDISRTHLFDIITQYRAVFTDDDSTGLRSGLFHNWLTHRVRALLQSVQEDVDKIIVQMTSPSPMENRQSDSMGIMSSLLAHAMYFGMSFGRVGCDFRPHVAMLFNQSIIKQFSLRMQVAVSEFRHQLSERQMTAGGISSTTTAASAAPSTGANPNANNSGEGNNDAEIAAPMALLRHPILALLCNAIVNALNQLRLCCTINVVSRLLKLLQGALQEVSLALLQSFTTTREQLSAQEKEDFTHLCDCFLRWLVPHVDLCASRLFIHSMGSSPLGVLAMEQCGGLGFKRRSALFVMDVNTVQGGCVDWLNLGQILATCIADTKLLALLSAEEENPIQEDAVLELKMEDNKAVTEAESLVMLKDDDEAVAEAESLVMLKDDDKAVAEADSLVMLKDDDRAVAVAESSAMAMEDKKGVVEVESMAMGMEESQ